MNIRSKLRRPNGTPSLLASTMLGTLSAVSLIAATGIDTATAATPGLSFYKGYRVQGEDIGIWKSGNTLAICDQPNLFLTSGQTFTKIAQITGLSTEQSQMIAFVLKAHVNPSITNDQAAAARIAVNAIKGNTTAVNRWEKALGATVTGIANSYITEAQHLHGPYKLSMVVQKGALAGSTGRLRVQVTSARGYGVPNALVKLGATNATLPSAVRTNSSGLAIPEYAQRGIGSPVFNGETALASTAVLIGNASSRQQQLKAAAENQIYTASATLVIPETNYQCIVECAGNPPVTTRAKNPARDVAQYVRTVDGKINAVLTLNPGQTGSITAKVADGKTLVTQLRYKDKITGIWSHYVTVDKQVIDCPVVPLVQADKVCDCVNGVVNITLTLTNPYNKPVLLYFDGNVIGTVTSGQTVPFHLPAIAIGNGTIVKYWTAVRKGDGSYNTSPVMGDLVG